METHDSRLPSLRLVGLVRYTSRPEEVASFFRDALGAPFERTTHGTVGEHPEALWNGTHHAIWRSMGPWKDVLVPTYRVDTIDAAMAALSARRLSPQHAPLSIGQGKRVVTFADPDGHPFRLIEIAE
jgi:catechol 2,3-dioxygenase-like lactoylglutathione lyase family enzyme